MPGPTLDDLYDGREALNNVTTTNSYDDNTLFCRDGVRINFEITGAVIEYRLGKGPSPGQIEWGTEVALGPSLRSYDRVFDAVQVKSFIANTPAQVTVEAVPRSALSG